MTGNMHIHPRLCSLVLLVSLCVPLAAESAVANDPAGTQSYRQEFIITAYYSPLPNQCCYVLGSYEADVVMNGKGTNGASGAAVHPGMAAAPKEYPFGTRINLPGIGTVTVEDRGGAIRQLGDGTHRLDLWVGSGEEGLARALAFGMRTVTGTVYPRGTAQPAEAFALESLEAPLAQLSPYLADADTALLQAQPTQGETGLSVLLLQQRLRDAGFLRAEPNGHFGPQTAAGLAAFVRQYGLQEPGDRLTQKTAAFLIAAAADVRQTSRAVASIGPGSDPSDVKSVQRTLRFFGYYRGRTDGAYGATLKGAILAFQKDNAILSSSEEPGAGLVGPKTGKAIARIHRVRLVAQRAEQLLMIVRIDEFIARKGIALRRYLGKGAAGEQVRVLQRLLAEAGFLGDDRVTGYFGDETERAVIAYQLDRGVIKKRVDQGAGTVGPATRQRLTTDQRVRYYNLVRGYGWGVL